MGGIGPLLRGTALLLFAVLTAVLSSFGAARSVHVAIHASWNATSPSAEALTHILDTSGHSVVIPFLQHYANAFEAHLATISPDAHVDEATERAVVLDALGALSKDHSLSVAALRWVLSARIHSPHVHRHYGLARRALALFPHSGGGGGEDAGSESIQPAVFAVVTAPGGDVAALVLQPEGMRLPINNARHVARYPPPALAPSHGDHVPVVSLNCPASHTASYADEGREKLPTVVLYVHLPDVAVASWLRAAVKLATQCTHVVALRFAPPPTELKAYEAPRMFPPLSAFVAHVTLRSTEYKVVDDRVFETSLFDDCPQGLSKDHCISSPSTGSGGDGGDGFEWKESIPPEANETFHRILATHFVHHRAQGRLSAALDALALVTEDAPALMRSPSFWTGEHVDRMADKSFEKAVRRVRSTVGDFDFILLNGFPVDMYAVRQGGEKLLRCLSTFAAASRHFSLLAGESGVPSLPHAREDAEARLRVVLPIADVAPNALVWFNDVFADTRYKKWPQLDLADPDSVAKFVQKVDEQSGRTVSEGSQHLRLVKARAHHLSMMLVLDGADMEHLPYLSVPESVVRSDLPIRVGAILVPNGRSSELVAAAFYHFLGLKGRKLAVHFVSMLRQVLEYFSGAMRGGGVTESVVDVAFQQVVRDSGSPFKSAAEVLNGDERVVGVLREARKFAEDMRLFVDAETEEGIPGDGKAAKKVSMLCTFNGVVVKDVAAEVIPLAVREQERVAKMLSGGLFEGESVESVKEEQWVEADESLVVVKSLSKDMRSGQMGRSGGMPKKVEVSNLLARDVFGVMQELKSVHYLNDDYKDNFNVTVWLAGSSRDTEEFKRIESIVEQVAGSEFAKRTRSRLAVVADGSHLNNIMLKGVSDGGGVGGILAINGRRMFASALESMDDLTAEIASDFGMASIAEDITGEIRLLYQLYEREIGSACGDERLDDTMNVSPSQLVSAVETNKASDMSYPADLASVISSERDGGTPLSILALIDPMDSNAYMKVSVLRALRKAFSEKDMSMGVVVAPSAREMKQRMEPPKTFYKFLFSPDDLAKQTIGGTRFGTRLSFDRLPQESVLTVAVEPPRAWFVSSYMTNYDMDNVILDKVEGDGDLFTEYQLKNLIVEGSCIDESEQPPQGLKLMLANEDGIKVDTLVMANLGYFQLKVPVPGTWWLSLARGASSRIFMLRSMEMFKDGGRTVFPADGNGRVPIPVESLSGAGGILLRVSRRPGMEKESVLKSSGGNSVDSAKDIDGFGNGSDVMRKVKETMRRVFGRKSLRVDEGITGEKGKDDAETINVFSVASGHLYERFLKIMISSVTKNASRKVKFWLLENYLSPSFKKMLPEFAKDHGAEVAMVTYRWPGWLRAQTEKQRIIWAYKILFLDVLFPLDVGRIIFVDSDQVIRGDLAELMDIDLNGAPYGYVPFCDSRKEVEGYRFWKSGFWKDTLQGAKYRISALYVVDLNRFRETAAGDTLRFIYQSLSADPNSLSNLDQDLPNYASVNSMTGASVPIFDLPQEWLWCESWCDDDSKSKAKAIDLCNNPMTKEPKLESAKRIIAEWVDLDDRASELTEVIYKRLLQGEHGSRGSAHDSDTPITGGDDDGGRKTEL